MTTVVFLFFTRYCKFLCCVELLQIENEKMIQRKYKTDNFSSTNKMRKNKFLPTDSK